MRTAIVQSIRQILGLALLLFIPTCAWPQISDGEIRVGLLLDMNSIYAELTGQNSVVAARMAIEDAGGQINGKPIGLRFADHANDSTRAAQIAQKWLGDEGVDVIADVAGSPTALAVQKVAHERGALAMFNSVMTDAITTRHCSPTSIHWMYDGYAFNTAIGGHLTRGGFKTWYFLSVDNAFGTNVEKSLEEIIGKHGGTVVGRVRHPLGDAHLFDKLRQASESGAQVIALINAGNDMVNAVRQSFDLLRVGRRQVVIAAVASSLRDVHKISLPLAQGMRLSHSFYWNLDAATRAWSMRYFQRTGTMPNDMQAGVYSSLMHYFKAVAATNSDHGLTVAKKMRELPIEDALVRRARLRADGRMVHDIYLMQAKRPSESREPWDYLDVLETIPGDQAFATMRGECRFD